MNIYGLTVCVNYADLLEKSLAIWARGCRGLIVVTTDQDLATQELCASFEAMNVLCYHTDAFTRHGAAFNKGAGMQEAIDSGLHPWQDWWLFFDADIIPPADWHDVVAAHHPQRGLLYGAHRWQLETGAKISDREWPGYFQLFHTSDPAAQAKPLLDVDWAHAGNYDTVFQNRWGHGASSERKVRLPLKLLHQGPVGNWHGRGPEAQAKMNDMYRRRREAGGSYEHERIQPQ